MVFVGLAIGPQFAGYFLPNVGYSDSFFYSSIALNFAALLYVLFICPESLPPRNSNDMVEKKAQERVQFKTSGPVVIAIDLISRFIKSIFSPVLMFAPRRIPGSQRLQYSMPLVGTALFLYIVSTGVYSAKYLYAQHVFSWNTAEVCHFGLSVNGGLMEARKLGYYMSMLWMFRAFNLLVFLPIVLSYFNPKPTSPPGSSNSNAHDIAAEIKYDRYLAQVSVGMDGVADALVALMASRAHFQYAYIALSCLSSFTSGANPALHSLGAICLHACGASSEVGALFGAMGVLSAVAHVISPSIYALTYGRSVASFPEAIFVLAALLLFSAVLLLSRNKATSSITRYATMSGVDFPVPGFYQGNYMTTYPLQQQVVNAIDKNDPSLNLKGNLPDAGNCVEGFKFWEKSFSSSTHDDVFATTVNATGQPVQAPVEANLSNWENLPPALPAPTSTQPPADPALPNGFNVVGPWPAAPVPNATSTAANDSNLSELNALAPSYPTDAAQPPLDVAQWCLENGMDPAEFMAMVAASNAMQIPTTNEPVDLGFPNIEDNVQGGTSTSVNGVTYIPQVNGQVPQLHEPQPLLGPELGNDNANSLVTGAFMTQSGYYTPNADANGTGSMGMAADRGFTPPPPTARPSAAISQGRSQRRQALRAAQAPLQPQPQHRRVPQPVQAPQQQAQFVQTPQLDSQYLVAQQMTMSRAVHQPASGAQVPQPSPTPAMVMNGHVQNSSVPGPATFFLLPPSMAIPPGNQSLAQYSNVLGANGTPHLLAAQPNPNSQSPLLPNASPAQVPITVNSATLHYAQKAFELEEQKKKTESLMAQLKELQDRQRGFNTSPTDMAPAPLQTQPVPTRSAMVSIQPIANASPAVPPPPQQHLTQFQPTPSFANMEQINDFNQPSGELSAFNPDFGLPSNTLPEFPTDFGQEFGTMPPPLYSAATFEDQWQQAVDFDNIPQMTLDLSQQQQDFVSQAQAYLRKNGHGQLSNHVLEEHHLGTLRQQRVEQVQDYGNLPQEHHNLTNGNHFQEGDGGAASGSSPSSSKRKRDEAEGQANNQQEAGGVPSPPKRQRTRNTSADKGKGKEEAAAGDETVRSTKRKQGEGSAKPPKPKKPRVARLGETETLPMAEEEAFRFLRVGRLCDWKEGCDHPLEPDEGAYWKHVKACHNPVTSPGANGGTLVMCPHHNIWIQELKMATHLDVRHACEKELKCCGCDEVLRTEEYSARSLHFSRNKKCREGSKMLIGIEPPCTVVLNERIPPKGLSLKEQEKDEARAADFSEKIRLRNERNVQQKNWGLTCNR
ncbi:hypothetical protein MD484_g4989, partial [Candolleomyces efflorescens]